MSDVHKYLSWKECSSEEPFVIGSVARLALALIGLLPSVDRQEKLAVRKVLWKEAGRRYTATTTNYSNKVKTFSFFRIKKYIHIIYVSGLCIIYQIAELSRNQTFWLIVVVSITVGPLIVPVIILNFLHLVQFLRRPLRYATLVMQDSSLVNDSI